MKNRNFTKSDYSLTEGIARSYYILRQQGVEPLVAHLASTFEIDPVYSYVLYNRWGFDPNPRKINISYTTIHVDDVEFTKLNPFSNTGKDAIIGTGVCIYPEDATAGTA